jgi:hypothetical protein
MASTLTVQQNLELLGKYRWCEIQMMELIERPLRAFS